MAFPLLRLPLLPLLRVCRCMDLVELFAFSLVSKRTNVIAEHLKITRTIVVNVKENHFELCFKDVQDILIYLDLENDQSRTEVKLQNTWLWNNLPISTSELLNRTFDVFHCELIDQLHLMNTPRYNMSTIIATLPNIKKVTSFLDITNETILRALKALLPKTSRVCLFPEAEYDNPEKLQEILVENLDYIEIIPFGCDFRLNLDDILITNATEAYFYCVSLREQDLNRFLKLWISGTFNTRLEHLRIALQEDFNRDNVLNGLNAIELPRTTTRTFEFPTSQTISSKIIYGGHDIRRGDGDLVTFDILVPGTLYVYDIYFWS